MHPTPRPLAALVIALLAVGCDGSAPAPVKAEVAAVEAAPTPAAVQTTAVPVKGSDAPTKKKNRWLGLSVANMTDPIPGAPRDRRGIVSRAFRGGPAHLAGLKRGDVLLRAADTEVLKYQDYIGEARKVDVGEVLPLRIHRAGKEIDVQLAMIDKPRDLRQWKVEHWKGTEMLAYEADLARPAGKTVSSAASKGKVRVLYFWATWCGPCRSTAPIVEAMHTESGEHAEVLAVSSEDLIVINKYLEKSTTTYPVVHDALGDLKLDYEVKKLPTIVVIDAEGSVVSWDTSVSGVRRAASTVQGLLSP
jgi:thiol-disulfide isomerase/thioredoxin